MSGTLRIRRIRLINFHNFVDETLPVKRNLFLIGDNQSGKTTVLDAVHFALSAGVEMEFNAAARFGPRSEPGRTLASIALRYDLERDQALRGPSIAYAALELEDDGGLLHTCGAGAFATSLDCQPEVWGFLGRGRGLDEVPLSVSEEGENGSGRRRPLDRSELEAKLGRGCVLDKGRYRSALGQFLFRDRDAYMRALELISAAKAYRELVARARNLDELFVGLLPPPAEGEFEEVRSALRAIDGIRINLQDLEAELAVLRFLIEKIQGARHETEKIARYEFVGAEFERRISHEASSAADAALSKARSDAGQAEGNEKRLRGEVESMEEAIRALRASEGAGLLQREEEVRADLAGAEKDRDQAEKALLKIAAGRELAVQEAARAQADLEGAQVRAGEALQSVAGAVRDELGEDDVNALGALLDAVEAVTPDRPASREALSRPLDRLRQGFESLRERSVEGAALGEREARDLRGAAKELLERAEEVRKRAEVLPDLPGYSELLLALEKEAPAASPLYRLFELDPALPESFGSAVECMLGPRTLGAIVAPPDQETVARERVLAHGGGVEVLDRAELAKDSLETASGSLPAALRNAGPAALVELSRRYLFRVSGEVRLLNSGEPRQGLARAIWPDGSIYDQGAEAHMEPGPPRFLGEAARRRAAALEEEKLRADAERLLGEAETAGVRAREHREVAGTSRSSLAALEECQPQRLVSLRDAAERARTTAQGREADERESEGRFRMTEEHAQRLRDRHREILALVEIEGLVELSRRIERGDKELLEARRSLEAAVGERSRRKQEVDDLQARFEAAKTRFDEALLEMEKRREALLPLVEPRYRADLEDYVYRIMRGQQIVPENLPDLIQEASNSRARAFESISSSDGIRNEKLWQKYAFRLEEDARQVRDQAGRPVEVVFEERDGEVRALQTALDEKTRDLLERVVMAGLVRRLQGQVRELRETIEGINRLAEDLRFGESRFRFSLRQRPQFQRLLELLREQSVLQPSLREELRDFFQARLEDLKQAREGEVPEILDYRRWFEYGLQVSSRAGVSAQDLPRNRLRFGSGGEQAVPTYLLILAVASLLFDRTEARLRLLLLDEAFLGIDAGRREVLLQFADRAGVDLIVATPELDGVTPALSASSTLFIEKTPELDIFVSDYQWQRSQASGNGSSCDRALRESDLVLGGRRDGTADRPRAEDRLQRDDGDGRVAPS